MRMLEFARRNRLPYLAIRPRTRRGAAPAEPELPLVRLPGGAELRGPRNGELSRALGIGLELAPREEVDLLVVGGGPAGLGAAVYGASEGLDTLVVESTALGGQAGTSRRIENYLGFPAGISGTELTSRAVTQARKFGARTATPYRASRARAGRRTPRRPARGGPRDRRARRRARHRRRIPPPAGRRASTEYEGISVFYAAGPPEAQLCGASGSPSSAAATPPARRRSGLPAAARSSRCSTAAPTCARRCPTT